MTEDKIALLKSLNAQQAALTFACNVASQAKDKDTTLRQIKHCIFVDIKKEVARTPLVFCALLAVFLVSSHYLLLPALSQPK